MTPFEKLYTLATGPGPIVECARKMVGEDKLALMLAKAALSETTESLSATEVGKVLDITRQAADERIDKIGFERVVKY